MGGTAEENRKTLQRIVALLLALATLCDRASGRSAAVRAVVLWLLRPGEEIATRLLERLTGGLVDPFAFLPAALLSDPGLPVPDGAAEALRLAQTFRALAAAIAAVLAYLAEGIAAPWPALAAQPARCDVAASATADAPPAFVARRDSS